MLLRISEFLGSTATVSFSESVHIRGAEEGDMVRSLLVRWAAHDAVGCAC